MYAMFHVTYVFPFRSILGFWMPPPHTPLNYVLSAKHEMLYIPDIKLQLYFNLQMLNYCIERKKELYERSSKPTSTTSLTSLKTQKADPVVESTEQETTPQKTSWKVEANESDSDDEFFEAVEEQYIVSKNSNEEEQSRLEASAQELQSQNDSPSGSFISLTKSASAVSFERIGVAKETEMKLLEADEPLCIPITQVNIIFI